MAVPSGLARSSPYAIFRNRNFSLMWTGQLVSTAGSALTSLAAGILIYRLTGSAMSVAFMMMATALPTLLVGLLAGVFVDRYDRKKIMVASEYIRAVLIFLIPFLVAQNIIWLYVIVALTSAVGQFFDPAHESVLPEVASEEQLAAANSLIAIASFGSTAIGFAASGLIASTLSINWAFYLDALSFIVSGTCILLIRINASTSEGNTNISTVVSNLKAGIKFLYENSVLRSVVILVMLYSLSVGLWNSLLLPFSDRALGANEFQYGLQEGLTSVGFVICSLIMAQLADRLREGQWITISLLGMGIVGVLYSFSTSIPWAIFLVMLSGFLNAPYGIARSLIVQRNTPREVRGRVYSAIFVTRDVVFLIGMVLAGLADVVPVRLMMAGSTALLLGLGILALFLPGLGQPAAEWRRAVSLLRGVKAAPGLGVARAAALADFDQLALHLPALASLSLKERQELAAQTLVARAESGSTILRVGEESDAAYIIIEGRAVAGTEENGKYRVLSTMNAGDFFGEIAALTGMPRTANVVAEEPTTVLQVPADTLRMIMKHPELNRLFLSTMTERMMRSNILDMPRYSGINQQVLRELRVESTESEPVSA